MKNPLLYTIIAFFILIFFISLRADVDVQGIVQYIEQNLAPPNFIATYMFKNQRSDGTLNEYRVYVQGQDIEHIHIRFLAPDREKGREVLRNDDDMWTFVPSAGRVMRIEDQDSFAGGDFSNADVLRIDWTNDYNASLLQETENQYIIRLTAKENSDAPYARMRLWVNKSNRMPVQQNLYDSNGNLLKQALFGEVQQYGDVVRPSRIVMRNMITNELSEMRVISLSTNEDIPDSRFLVSNLGQ